MRLSVKAVHLEVVSDLSTKSFIACLRRFAACCGKPNLTIFLSTFTASFDNETTCSSAQRITWKYIPERPPHFGGLTEAAVKFIKRHLACVVGNVKLNLKSYPPYLHRLKHAWTVTLWFLLVMTMMVLKFWHWEILLWWPLEALPDPDLSSQLSLLLKRWHLCQSLVNHFWQRWSIEYLTSLQRMRKWQYPSCNLSVGDGHAQSGFSICYSLVSCSSCWGTYWQQWTLMCCQGENQPRHLYSSYLQVVLLFSPD